MCLNHLHFFSVFFKIFYTLCPFESEGVDVQRLLLRGSHDSIVCCYISRMVVANTLSMSVFQCLYKQTN